MLSSKKTITAALLSTVALSANAQFFDITEQGEVNQINKPTGNYQTGNPTFVPTASVEQNPVLETSGDEAGFIPEQDPDMARSYNSYGQDNTYNAMPVSDNLEVFSNSLIQEEQVAEQLRDSKQLDYIGFLDSNFDEALWLGVSYSYAEKRFANFKDIKSVHVKNIMKNMLLAKARAPQSDKSWLALRLNTLISMGKLSDAKLLLKEVKTKELLLLNNHELNSLYLQSNLLEDDAEANIKSFLQKAPSNVEYKKALLINMASQGKLGQARLTFNALKESDSTVASSNFGVLFNALVNSSKIDVSVLKNLDVYDQYIISLNNSLFENANYSKFADQVLLETLEKQTVAEEKVKFAEILMNSYPYAYNVNYLVTAYEAFTFTSQELTAPLSFIKDDTNVYRNRALLFQSSKLSSLNSTKALSLKKLWTSYKENRLSNLNFLVTEKTQGINVNSSIAWFSMDILKNELKQARIEYATLKTLYENIDNANLNSNILNLQIAVEFLRKTHIVTDNFDSIQNYKETLNEWFAANKIKTKQDYNYVLKVLTILDALEAPIEDDLWAKLYENAHLETKVKANPIWLRLITSAMQKEQKGKSLLLVAEKFVGKDEKSIDPQTLANIIATLNYLNMPQDMALIGSKAIIK